MPVRSAEDVVSVPFTFSEGGLASVPHSAVGECGLCSCQFQ